MFRMHLDKSWLSEKKTFELCLTVLKEWDVRWGGSKKRKQERGSWRWELQSSKKKIAMTSDQHFWAWSRA